MTVEIQPHRLNRDPSHAETLVEGKSFQRFLGPTRRAIVSKAGALKENGDSSVSVYRQANLQMGAYLGAVTYIMLFDKEIINGKENFKSVAVSVTDDGFGGIQYSSDFMGAIRLSDFDFEHMPTRAHEMPENIANAVELAQYPREGYGNNLPKAHEALAKIKDIKEHVKSKDGIPLFTTGVTQRIF